MPKLLSKPIKEKFFAHQETVKTTVHKCIALEILLDKPTILNSNKGDDDNTDGERVCHSVYNVLSVSYVDHCRDR